MRTSSHRLVHAGLVLASLVVLVTVSVPLVPTARAAPLQASVARPLFYTPDEALIDNDFAPPYGQIADALGPALTDQANAIFSRSDAWKCLQAKYGTKPWVLQVLPVVHTPAPVTPRLWQFHILVTLTLGKKEFNGGDRSFSLQGEKVPVQLPRTAIADPDPTPMQLAATTRLREIFAAWTGPVPCRLKAKAKGKVTVLGAGTNDSLNWESEDEISLNQEGKFAATIKIPTQVNGTSITGGCKYAGTVERELRVAGSFRPDGALEFSTMVAVDTASKGSASCGGREVPWSGVHLFDGNWLGEDDIAMAFEHGAVLRIPRPIGPWRGEWEATLELVFEEGPALPRAELFR